MPATSSVTNRFQFIRWDSTRKRARPQRRPRPLHWSALLDRLVITVDDLEDVESDAGHVAVDREPVRRSQDRGAELHLGEVLPHLRAADLAVLARRRDGAGEDLGQHVVRRTERARRAGELLVE